MDDRAARDGQQNLPAKSEIILNEPQIDICNRIFSGILLLNQFLDEQVGAAVAQARSCLGNEISAERLKAKIQSAIDTIFFERRADLLELRRADLSAHRGLRYFRHKNSLNREAHYHDSVVMLIGVIAAAFVLESLVNGVVLSQVMTSGLLGGAVLAGMISAINIGAGFIAGLFGWRLLGHKRLELKALGIGIALGLHAVAISWNVLVGHFREVAELLAASDTFEFEFSKVTAATLNHIHEHGFLGGIASVPSLALLIVGILIHFAAAREGFDDAADRYLDYKKYDKRARDARSEFDEAVTDLRAQVREAVEEVEGEISASADELRRSHRTIKEFLDLARQRQQEVHDSEDEWVAAGTQLLKTYRDINTKVRDPGSAPAYFETYPTPQDFRRRSFGGPKSSDEVEEHISAAVRGLNELAVLADVADTRAKAAEELVSDIHKYITSAIRKVDRRLELESETLTEEANKLIDDEAAGAGDNPIMSKPRRVADRVDDEELV